MVVKMVDSSDEKMVASMAGYLDLPLAALMVVKMVTYLVDRTVECLVVM